MIELKDVSCSFSDRLAHKGRFTAVSSMTANFEDGGRYAIVGESGSGKTTLARMIAGLQRPSTGAISVDGSLWSMDGQGREKNISKKCRSSSKTPLRRWTPNFR